MKKILLLTLLASPLFTLAQKYFPMPTEKAKWTYVTPDGQIGFPPFWDYLTSGPDTVFNGLTYHTIMGACRFREDNKRIYQVFGDSTETIIYDFNLKVGDTFICDRKKYGIDSSAGVLTKIDSVLVLHQYHKSYFFTLNRHPGRCCWIEGVGSLNSLFNSPFPYEKAETGTSLCNFYMNDSFAYYDGYYCGPEAVATINPEPPEIEFYPNPASDILYINALKNQANFQLIDITGRVILSKKIYIGNSILNIEEIPQGMYYIKVEDGLAGKFVKL